MPIRAAVVRSMAIRRRAREFATMVKQSNMAHKLPDELIDWLKDDEIEAFKAHLKEFRLVQRKDYYWEEDR